LEQVIDSRCGMTHLLLGFHSYNICNCFFRMLRWEGITTTASESYWFVYNFAYSYVRSVLRVQFYTQNLTGFVQLLQFPCTCIITMSRYRDGTFWTSIRGTVQNVQSILAKRVSKFRLINRKNTLFLKTSAGRVEKILYYKICNRY
jgi:hypothetical protein